MSDTRTPNLNSKFAWRDIPRRELPKRSLAERTADFLEIYALYDEATAREQASRCLQCPNPTCVTGCPLCNPIPEWMLLTAEGRFLEAAAVLGAATNLAEVCARLCPSDHLCEGACLLESASEAVPIRALEEFLTEYAFAHGRVDTCTAPPNGRKVAVVGSGPACLACAELLARAGYGVSVFDSALVPGGLEVNGAPAFKLGASIVQRRVDLLQKLGVELRLGAGLWREVRLERLRAEFDAVFLGLDARKARPLEIPGAGLQGVVQALPFVLQKSPGLGLEVPPIDAAGKRVVVLGAGDTAMDCLRMAIRCGAREAIGVYRRDQGDMPCGRREYENAVEEGARFVFCAAPVAVLGNDAGQVTGVRLVRTELGPTETGGPRPYLLLPGTEFDLGADWVVPALGFDPMPCPQTEDFAGFITNAWGGLTVDAHQMTNVPGVFAGGDLVRGPSLVLHAVRDARRAAEQIDAYLSGRRR